MILAIYNPINVEKVEAGVEEEVHRLLRDGVTERGARQGQDRVPPAAARTRADDRALGSMLAENLYVGRTMQFQAELEQKIKELTPEAVNAALRKHIDPKRLSVITAGDFKKQVASRQ